LQSGKQHEKVVEKGAIGTEKKVCFLRRCHSDFCVAMGRRKKANQLTALLLLLAASIAALHSSSSSHMVLASALVEGNRAS
jgi:hypothetical protein